MNLPGWFQKAARRVGVSITPIKPKSEYGSGQTSSRKRQRIPGGQPRDGKKELANGTRTQIVKRSRHIGQNSGFSEENADLMDIYAIGAGMRPQATTEDADWNGEAELLFNDWSRRPEITGQFSLGECQTLISRAIDRDGEVFILKTRDRFGVPRIQLLETHRISNETDAKKRIYDGIQYDRNGRPRFYLLIVDDDANPYRPKTRKIRAASILHIFEPRIISGSRALPPGQQGLLGLQDSIETSSLMSQKVKDYAEKSMVLKSDRADALADGDIGFDSEDQPPQQTDEQAVSDALGGRSLRINADESLDVLTSQEPHANFHAHLEYLEREASGGRLPFEFTRNSKDIGGASIRMITSKVGRKIERRQGIIQGRGLNPLWFFVIGDAIDEGITPRELAPVPGWHRVGWTPTKSITVDAGRESQANREDIIAGIKPIGVEQAERGSDFDEWLAIKTTEARKIMTAAGIAESEPIPLELIYNPGSKEQPPPPIA